MIKALFMGINIGWLCYLIFFQKKETESTWAWILLLLHFPVFGFFLFLFMGQSLSEKDRMEKIEAVGGITEDNQLNILITGEEKFRAVFEDIRNAKTEILMQYYIYRDDFLFEEIKKLLCQKAMEGVVVKVLYDGFGSRRIRKKDWKWLQQKGVRVKPFRPWGDKAFPGIFPGLNHRNHRKILVIDRHIGYFGGFNVGKEYLGMDQRFGGWRDTHFRMVGSAVDALRNVFLKDWQEETDTAAKGGIGGSAVQMVISGPDTKAAHIRNVYLRCISKARKRIWIQTPYFVPDGVILNALKLAILSGIEVKLMLPSKPDHLFVYPVTRYYASQLLEMGAEIYLYQDGFLHAKGVLMDDEIYCYGTANLDNRSFYLNYEINAIVYGRDEVRKMEEIYEQDLKKCRQLTWQEYAMENPVNRVTEQIFRLLSPLL